MKNNEEKFSVLMSIYYKEEPKYLEESLKSILIDQTLLPTEIIMVKDGKLTKELENVLDKYKKMFPTILKFFPLEKNVGLGKALQLGLQKCKCDIVMRMDTDDVAVPERFKKQIEYMKKHPEVAVLGGYIEEFENEVNNSKRIKQMPILYKSVLKYSKFRNPLNHMTVCFRKKDVLSVGNYQPLYFLEDHYLWARILVAGKIVENLPEVLVYARIGNGFNDRRGNKKYIEGWKVLQSYLYKNKFINRFEKIRNMLGMYTIVYVPPQVRMFLYDNILRKKNKSKKI